MNILILSSFLLVGGWNLSLDTGLNLSQSYYNDAWEGDEMGTITWTAISNFDAEKQLSTKLLFSNSLKLAFGQTHSQDSETKKWNPPVKSTDKIDNEAMLRLTMGWPVDPFISFRLLSQIYDKTSTLYFNPISLTESFGLARLIVGDDKSELTSRIGVAFKENINRGDSENTLEGGFEWLSWGEYKLSNKIFYEGKFRIFKSLYNSKASELPNEYWKTPDVDFENTVSVSLSKFFQLTFYVQIIYDKEKIDIVQIKENIAFGLFYKIF